MQVSNRVLGALQARSRPGRPISPQPTRPFGPWLGLLEPRAGSEVVQEVHAGRLQAFDVLVEYADGPDAFRATALRAFSSMRQAWFTCLATLSCLL